MDQDRLYKKKLEYVLSFFKYASVKEVEKVKLTGVKNNADEVENTKYLAHYLKILKKAPASPAADFTHIFDDYRGKKSSRFIEGLYDVLPARFEISSERAFQTGGSFPVDHQSKKWTQKPTYKRWVSKLKRAPTKRHTKTEDLCVGEKSICKGHLGIPRKYMPQFDDKAEIQQFTRFVKKVYGIKSHKTRKAAGELKSSQREIRRDRVQSLIDDHIITKMRTPILISGDDFVIDGHHRWAAYKMKAPAKKMPAVVIDAPIKDILGIAVAWGAKHQQF